MKKLLLILLCLPLLFTTCKKEDSYGSQLTSGTVDYSTKILGAWELTKITVQYREGYWNQYNQKVYTQINPDIDTYYYTDNDFISFNANGTAIIFDNSSPVFIFADSNLLSYNLNGNTLELYEDYWYYNGVSNWEITELGDSIFEVNYDDYFPEEYNDTLWFSCWQGELILEKPPL